jgi:nitroimidazol reductase NimA-like FMN-containing flavoprotein (pyridoxamine 5'-phosphate oxidase superfamily)
MITDRRQIDAIIRGSDVCRLALSKDDAPYLVPMSFGYDGNVIYVHTAPSGRKIDYFEANSRVCFEFERNVRLVPDIRTPCDTTFAYDSVIGFGTIRELIDLPDKQKALDVIVLHYLGQSREYQEEFLSAVRTWEILIESVTAKRSPREAAE